MAKTKPTLEDYIFDMETRPPERSIDDSDDHIMTEQDVWKKLEKKENDLVLAAELGKALLEKNEELTKQQEKLIEEYSTKLEVSALANYYMVFCVIEQAKKNFFFYLTDIITHPNGLIILCCGFLLKAKN